MSTEERLRREVRRLREVTTRLFSHLPEREQGEGWVEALERRLESAREVPALLERLQVLEREPRLYPAAVGMSAKGLAQGVVMLGQRLVTALAQADTALPLSSEALPGTHGAPTGWDSPPACPSAHCPMCANEACRTCQASSNPEEEPCEHDCIERHYPVQAPASPPKPASAKARAAMLSEVAAAVVAVVNEQVGFNPPEPILPTSLLSANARGWADGARAVYERLSAGARPEVLLKSVAVEALANLSQMHTEAEASAQAAGQERLAVEHRAKREAVSEVTNRLGLGLDLLVHRMKGVTLQVDRQALQADMDATQARLKELRAAGPPWCEDDEHRWATEDGALPTPWGLPVMACIRCPARARPAKLDKGTYTWPPRPADAPYPRGAIRDATLIDPCWEMAREFHVTMGLPVAPSYTGGTPEQRVLRCRLMLGEVFEFAAASGVRVLDWGSCLTRAEDLVLEADGKEPDLVAMARELADVEVTVAGTAVELGIPRLPVVREVHAANMRKRGADGRPILRQGKVCKPEGWKPPDVAGVLERLQSADVPG